MVIRYGLMWRDAPACHGPHKTPCNRFVRWSKAGVFGRTRGGLDSKLHAVCDGDGKPVVLLLTAGQVSDYRGADTIVPALPASGVLIADKG